MRLQLNHRSILVGLFLTVLSAGVVTWARRNEPPVPQGAPTQEPSEVRQQQTAAYARGGLEAAAAVTGKYQQRRTVFAGSPASLFQYLSFAKQIVTGTVVSSHAFINSHSRSIDTVFDVLVSTVQRGNLEPGATIQIVVPGGRMGFSDRSWAQVDVQSFKTPLPNKNYLLFLRQAVQTATEGAGPAAGTNPMEPIFGGLGIVDMTTPAAAVSFSGGFDTPFYLEILKSRMTGEQLLARASGR